MSPTAQYNFFALKDSNGKDSMAEVVGSKDRVAGGWKTLTMNEFQAQFTPNENERESDIASIRSNLK